MFHPVLPPPQLPPSFEDSKPVDHLNLAAAAVVKVKTDGRKLIIVGKNQDHNYQSNISPINDEVSHKNQLFPDQSPVLVETSTPPAQPSNVHLQESEGKFHLSIGENKPDVAPVQNIIEFKLRNSENQELTPTTGEFPPSPSLPVPEKIPAGKGRVVEVIADRQEYDEKRRIVTADGHVVVRFDGAVIDADTMQINLDNLIAVGEGNVALTRGNQVLQGKRFTYN
ncbi:DUF3769 domain-containing protein, partial [Dolichospermum sp. ST_sed10]|nr:DUF3769 domain-containing protein [Dolichospermum sp. ST_sed10]